MPSSQIEPPLPYNPEIEEAIASLEPSLRGNYPISARALSILILQGDEEALEQVREQEGQGAFDHVMSVRKHLQNRLDEPVDWYIAQSRYQWGQALVEGALEQTALQKKRSWGEWLGMLCMNPITGFPILALVLYFGLYQFVGIFGAGTVVGLIEEDLFGGVINPFVSAFVERIIPWQPIQQLLVGEYGIWTLGVTYAVALILPIVTFFFLVFAVLEDSGYLPRLAMLIDRGFKALGLNGRAVIPIVLGFGCDTMATVVTRVLETRRERVLTTFLLSLTIPCSAQLGVVLALLSGHPTGLLIWTGVMVGVFLIAGWLAARVLPGTPAPFYMEIPPMRFPNLGNVLVKTLARLQWYFMEVFPLFLIASLMVWVGQMTGLFDLALRALQPMTQWLSLPSEAAVALLFGFFRRDYGAAGLYQLDEQGLLSGNQLLVAAVVLTLFVPCVAQFLVTIKERGWRMALGMLVFTLAFALLVGVLLSRGLQVLGISV